MGGGARPLGYDLNDVVCGDQIKRPQVEVAWVPFVFPPAGPGWGSTEPGTNGGHGMWNVLSPVDMYSDLT